MAADPKKLKKLKEINRRDILFCAALGPGKERLLAGSSDHRLYDFDLAAEKIEPLEMEGHESYVSGVVADEETAVSGGYDGRLIWRNLKSHKSTRTIEAHAKWIRRLAASPDGNLIASVADDMVARLWERDSGKLVHELRGHEPRTPHHYPSMLYAAAFSPDGKLLATGDKVGRVIIWDVASGKQEAELTAAGVYTWDPRARRHSIGGIRSLAFSPDGKRLAVGGMGKVGNIDHLGGKARVEIYDWRQGKQTWLFESGKHKGLANQLCFADDGRWLLAAGGAGKGFLLFLDPTAKKSLREEAAPMHVHDAVLAADGRRLYTVGHNRLVTWSLE